jgi:ParB-like chromosome segregation protein Spo0J
VAKRREDYPIEMVDPNGLVLRPDGIRDDKIERFGKKSDKGTDPPPIAVFRDTDGTLYTLDGNHRAMVAKQKGKRVPARVIDDDDYQIKGTDVVSLTLRMIFGVKND